MKSPAAAAFCLLLLPAAALADPAAPDVQRDRVCLSGDLYYPGEDPVTSAMKWNFSEPIVAHFKEAGYAAKVVSVGVPGAHDDLDDGLCYGVEYKSATEGQRASALDKGTGQTKDDAKTGCVPLARQWVATYVKVFKLNLVAASIKRTVSEDGATATCRIRAYGLRAPSTLPQSITPPADSK